MVGFGRAWASLAAAAALVSASPAAAAQFYNFHLTGTLVSELGQFSEGLNTGVDPNFALGDILTLTARIRADQIQSDGSLSVAYFSNLDAAQGEFWRIEGRGLTWLTTDDIYDGFGVFSRYLDYATPEGQWIYDEQAWGAPGIIFSGSTILGVMGYLSPASSSARPVLQLGSYAWGYDITFNTQPGEPLGRDIFISAALSPNFRLEAGDGLYGNTYNSQGFIGDWNFAASSVAIPEPSTWVLLIAGFGLSGAALRRKSRSLTRARRASDVVCP